MNRFAILLGAPGCARHRRQYQLARTALPRRDRATPMMQAQSLLEHHRSGMRHPSPRQTSPHGTAAVASLDYHCWR